MFLANDHAAFEIDRRRLAVWADIRHLQWGFAQRREYRKLQQHGRNPAEEVVGLFYIEVEGFTWGLVCTTYSLRSRPELRRSASYHPHFAVGVYSRRLQEYASPQMLKALLSQARN